jgi:hypothetical protein
VKSVITPQEQFNKISKPNIKRSTFDRSHGYKTTFDAGKLIPIFVDEALPGDTFNLDCTVFGRLATPIKPIMDNVYLDVHFFSCPIRLVWDNWVRMNGEQDNPDDTTDYIMPTMDAPSSTGYAEDTIYDYFGLPTKVPDYSHRTDFLRAMNLIWNEWYRDENLQDSVTVRKTDSGDLASDFTILPRGKRKDYFTSSLPFAQKADPVTIPLGTEAPVFFKGSSPSTDANIRVQDENGDWWGLDADNGSATVVTDSISGAANGRLYTNLTDATAATINAWREAFQIQVLYELDARGGTRYIELIRSHFGVISPDARLQRPEFLGGYTTQLNINPIAQNSETNTTPQGNLSAMGTFAKGGKGFIKSFTEHEVILGFISARADLNYQQGLNRMWSRSTRFDFFWPSLAHLGEQAILNKEIYTQGISADDDVFGYQERYSEYKFKPSMVTSSYRSNHSTSLDVWHLSQDFASLPTLNSDFIEENPPIDRVIAVPSEPQFLLDCYFSLKCARPIPVYSTPISLSRI